MSNHNEKPDAAMQAGATGRYPRGHLTPDDEGEIVFRIAHKDGVIVVDFGKPVVWIGLPPDGAREFAALLVKHAEEIERGR